MFNVGYGRMLKEQNAEKETHTETDHNEAA